MKEPMQPPSGLSVPQALQRANAHWNAGQAGQAEMLCQRVLAAWPGQADALHLLGLMAHARGKLDQAIAQLRQACQAPLAPAAYLSNLAEMCRQAGLLAEGEAAGRRAVQRDASHAGAWNNLGIILQEAGNYQESKLCLERVLALQPQNADAHNNLGNTCKRLGGMRQAERHWQRALALRTDFAEPHSNLANLLTEQGEYDRAAEHARRAIGLKPQFADAYINLAGVELARQRFAEALHWIDALLAFAPAHATGLAAKATALKKLDRLDEALDAAERALAAAASNAEAYHARGQVLQAMGRSEAALADYDQAIALPGTAAEQALVSRAVLFMEQGDKTHAAAAFEQAAAAFPRSAAVWFNRADLAKFEPGEPAFATMQHLLDGEETSNNDKMLLHFGLGKAFLDIGDSEQAFDHLDAGNRMKRATLRYDAAAATAWMAEIATVMSPALLHGLSGHGVSATLPVFVLGMPRSGTTLVEQILASHTAVHGAGELNHVQRLAGKIGYPAAMATLPPAHLAELGQAYLDAVRPLAAGKTYVVDKMTANFMYAGLIRLILPDARIIHCRRDAVDTCLSCYSKLFNAEQSFCYDQAELGQFHLDYQMLMAHWRETLPASHFLEVDYEAVVADVEAQTRRMLAFLGLPWDPACLAFHDTKRMVKTASVNQVRRPIYRSSAGRWRPHAERLGPLLAALGITAP